jgi:hypothetical protein
MPSTVPGNGAILRPYFDQVTYGITSIEVLNGGTGYASTNPPLIEIQNTTTPTTAGVFFPIIVSGEIKNIKIVSSGEGYFPLPTPVTAIGAAELDESGQVSRITLIDAGVGYTTAPNITISNPSLVGIGTFKVTEIVTGQTSGATARVKSWTVSTNTLEVGNITGTFVSGETIIGSESSAQYTIRIVGTDDPDDNFADNLNIEIEADKIIDFTETNPFGIV